VTDASTGAPLAVCLLPEWEGGSWLWVWHDVFPRETLLEDEVRHVLLATQIEQALRDPYITMVRFRGADDAREWVCAELERMGIDACVIEQTV
jgi:hypothetical protein